MGSAVTSLVEESIRLELTVSELYTIFHGLFPEDAQFWWQLVMEEKNHAALIRAAKDYFEPVGKFPQDLVHDSLQNLKNVNSNLLSLIGTIKDHAPTREEAFNIAFALENSAGELHFQQFMEKESGETTESVFQRLNKDDKDHARRIRSYMEQHGISCRKPGQLPD